MGGTHHHHGDLVGETHHHHGDLVGEGVRGEGERGRDERRRGERLDRAHGEAHDDVHRAARAPLQHPAITTVRLECDRSSTL